jgi:hypothetical protein
MKNPFSFVVILHKSFNYKCIFSFVLSYLLFFNTNILFACY